MYLNMHQKRHSVAYNMLLRFMYIVRTILSALSTVAEYCISTHTPSEWATLENTDTPSGENYLFLDNGGCNPMRFFSVTLDNI